MIDFTKAIKRPFSDATKMGIGFAMSLPIPFVEYFTNIAATGYALNCAKTAYEGKYELPEWKNLGRYWLQAFIAAIISFLYNLPVLLLLLYFGGDIISDFITDSTALYLNLLNNPLSIVNQYGTQILIPVSVAIIISYFVPVAILKYIINDKFDFAFKGDVFKKALTTEYFYVWIIVNSVDLIFVFFMMRIIYPFLNQEINPATLFYLILLTVLVYLISFALSIFRYTVYGSLLKYLEKT